MDKSEQINQVYPFLYLGRDVVTLILSFLIAIFFFHDGNYQEWFILAGAIPLWLFVGYWIKLYHLNLQSETSLQVINYIKSYLTLIGLVLLFYSLFPFPMSAKKIVAIVIGFPVLSILLNFLLTKFIGGLRNVKEDTKYTLIAGVGTLAENVEKNLYPRQGSNHQIKGFINCKKKETCMVGQEKIISDLEHIHQYLKENTVDEIVIALPVKRSKKIQNILATADHYGIRVKYVPDYKSLFGANYKTERYGQIEAVNVRQLPLDETFSFFIKNTFDKIFSAVALVLLSPLFIFLAILIKLDSPGPVFYSPVRIGKASRSFRVFKFRSMRENDASSGGLLSTQKDDPRITKTGKFIRKYSLDELPQFLNVLLGDMSVVGPRPHRSYLNQQFQASIDKYMIRHYFKPGITGWAQVNGWRGPTETEEQRTQRTLHDLWYMENWSLWLDIKIIYMTIFSRNVQNNAF